MSKDLVQFSYIEEEKTVKINLPIEVLDNINRIVITRLGEDEIIIEKDNTI